MAGKTMSDGEQVMRTDKKGEAFMREIEQLLSDVEDQVHIYCGRATDKDGKTRMNGEGSEADARVCMAIIVDSYNKFTEAVMGELYGFPGRTVN